jgi:plasmid stabilization system protein ParE
VKWLLVIRPGAETDLRDAKQWYESQRPGLGAEFIAELEAALQSLVRDPLRHPVYYRGFYRMFVHRFPYKLFYRVEGDRVIVSRILHARRDHPRLLRPEKS